MKHHSKPFVLFLPKWYPNRDASLDGIFIKQHALAVKPFAEVFVLYVSFDSHLKNKWLDFTYEVDEGIPTARIYYKKVITGIEIIDRPVKLLLFLIGFIKGFNFVKNEFGRPQLVHVHVLLRTGLMALFIKWIYGIKYVITEHWTGYLPENNVFERKDLKWITRLVAKNAASITTVSHDLREAMLCHGLYNEYEVIYNVVNTSLFRPAQKQGNEIKTMVHVSEFNEQAKNISGILRSIAILRKKRTDFKLNIIGYGPYEKQLKTLSDELELSGKYVFFIGKQVKQHLVNELNNSDFFVMFSNHENQPVVIIEAFAMGLPVVATPVGGISEILSEKRGKLVPPGDEEALANAMNEMLDNYTNYDSIAIRNYAVDNFSYEKVGSKFYELYLKLL